MQIICIDSKNLKMSNKDSYLSNIQQIYFQTNNYICRFFTYFEIENDQIVENRFRGKMIRDLLEPHHFFKFDMKG